jgi:hypothetical protein
VNYEAEIEKWVWVFLLEDFTRQTSEFSGLENAGEWLKSFCETRFDFAR